MSNECVVSVVSLVQGADKTFYVNLTVSEKGQPAKAFVLDAPPTNVEVRFPNEDGSVLRLDIGTGVTIEDAPGGRIKVQLTEAQTTLLKLSDSTQNFEIMVLQDIPDVGTTKIFCFEDALQVSAQKFPV